MAQEPRAGLLARLFGARDPHDTTPPAPPPATTDDVTASLPRGIRLAGAWSWRLLLLFAVAAVLVFVIIELRLIVIPLLIAVLISALLHPLVGIMTRWRIPRGIAITIAMLGTLAVVSGLVYLAIQQIAAESGAVRERTVESYAALKQFLLESPLHLTEDQISQYIGQAFEAIQDDSQALWTGALSLGSTLGHVAAGLFLALFCLLFILIDGKGIWSWIVRLFPRNARAAIDGAGNAGWGTLSNYARTQILVASIDAVGIGLGAALLGVPMAIPIGILVFLGAFVPIVGAVVTGAVAVFIALVYNGWQIALIMLIVVLLVQQVEGHVLQPLLMGTAVKVHPLAVVLVVAAGTMLAGIPGALFAVPVAAVINVMVRFVASGRWRHPEDTSAFALTEGIWQTVPHAAPGRGARKNQGDA